MAGKSATPRPSGSYRGSRRNEAKRSKKKMLRLDELRRINEMHAYTQHLLKGA